MNLKTLIGAGHKITIAALPFAVLGIVLNILYPGFFRINLGMPITILGCIFILVGVPIWITSVIQILINVPKGKLITTGPFALVLHPLYTSVSLLVIPGIGFVVNTWVGVVIGVVLYISSRVFWDAEESDLEEMFSDEYRNYRVKVLLPWL
jgi:protein-S-isoprenylcysteine O-methyltransferase Ste14